jgi:PAS domain S-box-containing protein
MEVLSDYHILDTPPEKEFDTLVELAAYICQTPISLVSILGDNRLWFKAKLGLDLVQTKRADAFCLHAMQTPGIYEVNDAASNPLFSANPLVTGDPHVRFYAGVPLFGAEGQALGTLCVIDTIPRELTPAQKNALQILANQAESNLRLRKQKLELEEKTKKVSTLIDLSTEIMAVFKPQTLHFEEANSVLGACLGYSVPEIIGQPLSAFLYPGEVIPASVKENKWPISGTSAFEARFKRKDQSVLRLHWSLVEREGKWYGKARIAESDSEMDEWKQQQENQTILQAFVEHTPAAIAMVDHQLQMMVVSQRWLSDFQLLGQSVTGQQYYQVLPDTPAFLREAHQMCLDKMVETSGEHVLTGADGQAEWLRWEVKPWFNASGGLGGLITMTEFITQRKQMDQRLKDNDLLLQGIHYASNQFLTISNYKRAIESALPVIGEALQVSHIYVYQNVTLQNGTAGFRHRFYWADDEDELSRDEDTLTDVSYTEVGLEHWHQQLKEGATVHSAVAQLQKSSKTMLKTNGADSLLLIPVLIGYRLWGFIRFDEYRKNRVWTPTEESLLSNLANTLGESIARNQAEMELVNTKNYLNNIINAIPAPIFVKDQDHRFMLVNDACCELNGISRDNLIGKSDFDLFPPEDAAAFREQEERIFQHGKVDVREETILRPNRSIQTVITQKATFKNEYGQNYLIGCHLDISDRKQFEKALVKEQHLLQTFMDHTPECIYFKDLESRFLRINKAMLSWLEVNDPGQLIGKTDFDFFPEPQARRAFEMEQEIIRSGKPLMSQEDKQIWAGRERWISFTKMPLYSEEGEIIGTFGISRDITSNKEAEIELTNSRNYLNHIFDSVPIPIFVKDSQHRWIFLNDAWCKFAGVEKEEMVGKTDYDLHPKEKADLFRQRDEFVFKTGLGSINEETLSNRNGQEKTVITKKTLFRDQYGMEFLVGTMIDITDTKNFQTRLVNYQNYLNTIINAVADPIFVKDRHFRLILVNDSFCQVLGFSREEVLNKTDYDLFDKEYADVLRSHDEMVFLTRQTQMHEETRLQNGVPKTLITKKTYFTNELNEEFLVGSATDITERKKVEMAITVKEKYFRSLIQYSSDIISVMDPDGKVRYQSPSYYQVFGYTEQASLGKDMMSLIHPEDRSNILAIFEQLLQQPGVSVTAEYRVRKRNGEWATLESVGTNYLNDDAVAGIVINSRDITERKKAEAKIRDQSQILHGIISNMPVVVFRTDPAGIFTQSIGAGLERVGLAENQVVGLSIKEVYPHGAVHIHTAFEKGFVSFVAPFFSQGQAWYFDTYIFKDIAQTGGLLGFAMDITDSKLAENKMQEYAVDLEKINKELDQFAYVVSHDLKAPLRAIANLSQWIEEDLGTNISDDIRDNMALLRGRVNRMQALINGVLDYSRVNRTNVTLEEVDILPLLQELISVLGVPETHPVLIDTAMPVLVTNQTRIEQVFSNLISNAFKYHDKPSGRISIQHEETKDFHQFKVVDDGPGIDPEYHEKVFVIFQTLQARDKVESTGVGLAIVKKIIEDQGGRIWIESQPGQGTAFVFTVPKQVKSQFNNSDI